MNKMELIKTVEKYKNKHGFLPGAVEISSKHVPSLIPILKEVLSADSFKAAKDLLDKDITKITSMPIMGLTVILKEELDDIKLVRASGRVSRIKATGMKEAYMPVADITNSMTTVIKAALSFFKNASFDNDFTKFTVDIGGLICKASEGGNNWEDDCLPKLEDIVSSFNSSKDSEAFFQKFFMCMMDFYWHAKRLIPGGDEATNRESFNKLTDISSLIRTMPKEMRKEYCDHLASIGQLHGAMTREHKGDA